MPTRKPRQADLGEKRRLQGVRRTWVRRALQTAVEKDV